MASHEVANLTTLQMGTVVLPPASVAPTMVTARNPRATTAVLVELAPPLLSVATRVSASQLVASAVPTVHTAEPGINAAATDARKRPIYAALTGRRAGLGTYASGMRSTMRTSAARIPLARHI